MYVDAAPIQVDLPIGQVGRITITLLNTSSVIDAYSVRVFGLDPDWVRVAPNRVSLFPGAMSTVEMVISLPDDYHAGHRELAIHVQSENDPAEFTLANVSLTLAQLRRPTLSVEPTAVTGRNEGWFNLVISNEGNATIEAIPEGIDPEDRAEFTFEPTALQLPPGH